MPDACCTATDQVRVMSAEAGALPARTRVGGVHQRNREPLRLYIREQLGGITPEQVRLRGAS